MILQLRDFDPRPVLPFFLLPFIGTAWLGRRKDTLWASGRVLGPQNLFRDGLSLWSEIVSGCVSCVCFVSFEAWMEPGWETFASYLQEETREIAEERPVVDVDFVELEAWQRVEIVREGETNKGSRVSWCSLELAVSKRRTGMALQWMWTIDKEPLLLTLLLSYSLSFAWFPGFQ